MSLNKPATSILQKGACFFWLAGLLGTSLPAAPIPLPDWVRPMESSLPKISPEVISEVDDILIFSERNIDLRSLPEIHSELVTNAKRIVELQERGDQAMIWQYLKYTNGSYGSFDTLGRLGGDRELAAWLLPVVRYRVDWLRKSITDIETKNYLTSVFLSSELYDITSYLFRQGEFDDIKNFNNLVDEAIRSGFKLGGDVGYTSSSQKRLRLLNEAMQRVRAEDANKTGPYWKLIAGRLISQGIITEEALKPRPPSPDATDIGNRPPPLGPRKPLPEIKAPTPFPQPWMVWPMWILIFAISASLLRWVFRKPKPASDASQIRIAR